MPFMPLWSSVLRGRGRPRSRARRTPGVLAAATFGVLAVAVTVTPLVPATPASAAPVSRTAPVSPVTSVSRAAAAAGTGSCTGGGYNPCGWSASSIMDVIAHPLTDTIIVSSHRGLHALVNGEYAGVPENSPEAIELAAKAGLAEIELDVKLDKDGTPVLSHDQTEGRQTNYSQDLTSLHDCSSNDCYDSFGDQSDPTNAARNPLVTSLSDSDLANGNLYTRDSVSGKLSSGVIWHPITLQDALNRMTLDGIQMVIALDIRTPDIARAALPVVANTLDSMGRSYLSDTMFKVPFISAPSASAVQAMFPEDRSEVNYQPVFNTGDACGTITNNKCQGFGGATDEAAGETNLANALLDVEDNSGVKVPAVELQIKKNGGNLQQLLETVNHYPGSDQRRSVTIFSPYQDIDPSAHGLDPSQAPYYFKTDGSCCSTLPSFFFKSTPNDQTTFPPDTTDQRPNLDFLESEGVNGITTDDAEDIASQIDTSHRDVPGQSPGNSPVSDRSCDVYTFYGTPCTVAVSTTRALYANYDGPLYQVQRASDSAVMDIGLTERGGYADAAAQDQFCAQTTCTITKIYDQSGLHNDLTVAGAGGQGGADHGADASALPVTVNGNKVYGVSISAGVGYRNDLTQGIARNGSPEGMYMVASGTRVNDQCCFDFGNAERNNSDTGNGHMDAVNLSARCAFAAAQPCTGAGPWVQADLENGLFQGGNGHNPDNTGNSSNFVTAMLKNDGTTTYALKGGDAQSGGLSTWWQGPLPDPAVNPGYEPMQQEGGIVLGVGGDNSNSGVGSFFEGVMTQGYPTDAADDAVQAGIVAAGYGGDSAGVTVPQNSNAAVVNVGLTNVFTVNAENDHLQWSSLTAQGADWMTKDLWATAGTPPVLPGTTPVAVVHDGVTSVFTISAADHHLWETHMRPGVTSFTADDLTALAGTPPSKVTPSALFHDGYTTVYTVNASNGHLQTTYLTVLNGPWVTADLTAQTPGAPAVQPATSPVSILHNGVASVFTVGTDHDIWETYLPTIDGTWSAHDITALSTGPQTTSTVTAVLHEGVLTVFAAGDPLRHLWELSLPSLGGAWTAQDLTAGAPNTPQVAPGTAPAALFHNGYTSVYTVDQTSLDLQTTYLPSLSGDYATEDLSADYKIPPTTETPVPLLHPGTDGALDRLSVFTVNHLDNDLQDSDLVAEGDPWNTQDMYVLAHVPPVRVNASPTATWSVVNNGTTYAFTVCTGDLCVDTENIDGTWQKTDLTAMKVAPKIANNTWPTAVAWDGHVSVFSVGTQGHLWQTDLPPDTNTWAGFDLTAAAGGPTTGVTPSAVFHGGYISVYTVNDNGAASKPGDLEEYYLIDGTPGWHTQDLSTQNPYTPQVAPYTPPVALYHDGYTSVFTADYSTVFGNDLQETYLTAIGNAWQTRDLTKLTGGLPMSFTSWPAVVYHSGYVSVFTPDGNFDTSGYSDLRETYLTAIGDNWQTQDLSVNYQVPKVHTHFLTANGFGVLPAKMSALYHSGYTSVYYVPGNNISGPSGSTTDDLMEAFLPAIGDSWRSQDLTTATSGPPTNSASPPSALLHYGVNGGLTWTSVFTYNLSDGSLQDTFLPNMGGSWGTKPLP
jgi:hypothetical protein